MYYSPYYPRVMKAEVNHDADMLLLIALHDDYCCSYVDSRAFASVIELWLRVFRGLQTTPSRLTLREMKEQATQMPYAFLSGTGRKGSNR